MLCCISLYGLRVPPGAGSQDGKVQVFDLTDGQPVLSWQAAADTVNGVGFHPYLPLAVSASGKPWADHLFLRSSTLGCEH